MADKFQVQKKSKLLAFLIDNLQGWARNKIKQRLQAGHIFVNEISVTKHDHNLQEGDLVQVGTSLKVLNKSTAKLEIIYSDKDLIAINKPAGLLSVSTTSETKFHALAILRTQLSRGKNQIKLWPVHRLDRDTSGILLFARSKKIREEVMETWDKAEKIYLAIVEKYPKESSGTINEPLRLDEKQYFMHVGKHKDAKEAITHYETQKCTEKTALLIVNIETGRQHQIRAHMAWLGHSIIGDERYGKKGNRLGLHSFKLTVIHPKTKKSITFKTEAPSDFYALLK